MSMATESRIPCSRERRHQLKALKRGGENYDSLLRKMVSQYDPETAEADVTDATDGGRDRPHGDR